MKGDQSLINGNWVQTKDVQEDKLENEQDKENTEDVDE